MVPLSLFIALTAVAGLLLGSFANVLVSRLPRGESIAFPASHCRDCETALRPWHNIPLLSWLALRGRCAYCRQPIGWRYPAVEATVCILFCFSAWRCGHSWSAVHAAALCFLCVVLFFTDLETMLLPDALTLPGIVVGIALSASAAPAGWKLAATFHAIGGAALGAAIPLAIRYGYRAVRGRHGMGLGDVKLLALIGAFVGPAAVVLVFALAVFAAALVYASGLVFVAALRSRRALAAAVPFGTFLCVSGVICRFYAPAILRWYLHFY